MPPTGGPSMALHHTECGMEYFTNDVMGDLLERSLETAELGPDGFRDIGTGPGSPAGREVDRLTIADREQSVVDDVTRIRSHPLVERTIPSTGSCTTQVRTPRRGPRRDPGRPTSRLGTAMASTHDEQLRTASASLPRAARAGRLVCGPGRRRPLSISRQRVDFATVPM